MLFFCRRGAYTCWPQSTGAEEFNYGSRIDHILCAGSCLHQEHDQQGHSFIACHVKECDILTQYKRWKPGNSLRYSRALSHSSLSNSRQLHAYLHSRVVDSWLVEGKGLILTYFTIARWKGGHRIKLEGSDHAPVYASLLQIPSIPQHSTPASSARYIPMIYGIQQTLGTGTFYFLLILFLHFIKSCDDM